MNTRNEEVDGAISEMEGIVVSVCRALVAEPNSVKVAARLIVPHWSIQINAQSADLKWILGKKGANINSLRALCRAIATKHKLLVELVVTDYE